MGGVRTWAPLAGPLRMDRALELPVVAVAWVALGAAFLGLRLAVAWNAPVAGVELWSLAGSWQAHVGNDDVRFVPSLAQAVTALTFWLGSSELPGRVLVVTLGSAMSIMALLRLRGQVADAALLTAGALLALDPFPLGLGGTASALAFDLPVALLLFSALVAPFERRWLWAPLGALVAGSGPLPLALVVAAAAGALAAGRRPPARAAAWAMAGAALGVIGASAGFGFGADGLVVPPFDLFAASFAAPWSTASAGEMALVYGWPLVVATVSALAWDSWRWAQGHRRPSRWVELAMAWSAVGLLWLGLAAGARATTAVGAVTVPGAFVTAALAAECAASVRGADWRLARSVLPLVGMLVVAGALFAFGWAFGRPNGSVALAALFGAGAAALTVALAASRGSRPAAVLALAVVAGTWLLAMAFRAVAPGPVEPLYSPMATPQGRAIRAAVLELAAGGRIVVHPDLADTVVWPLRGSGVLLVADVPPPEAAVVLTPARVEPPAGMLRLEGSWAFVRETSAPRDARSLLRWLASRNAQRGREELVSIAAKAGP